MKTEIEVAKDCSDDCEGRWGNNCLTHWIDNGWDRIVNDVEVLNELAKDPSAEINIIRKLETSSNRDIMLLEVRGMRFLITEYDNLEVLQTLKSYWGEPSIKFIRN